MTDTCTTVIIPLVQKFCDEIPKQSSESLLTVARLFGKLSYGLSGENLKSSPLVLVSIEKIYKILATASGCLIVNVLFGVFSQLFTVSLISTTVLNTFDTKIKLSLFIIIIIIIIII